MHLLRGVAGEELQVHAHTRKLVEVDSVVPVDVVVAKRLHGGVRLGKLRVGLLLLLLRVSRRHKVSHRVMSCLPHRHLRHIDCCDRVPLKLAPFLRPLCRFRLLLLVRPIHHERHLERERENVDDEGLHVLVVELLSLVRHEMKRDLGGWIRAFRVRNFFEGAVKRRSARERGDQRDPLENGGAVCSPALHEPDILELLIPVTRDARDVHAAPDVEKDHQRYCHSEYVRHRVEHEERHLCRPQCLERVLLVHDLLHRVLAAKLPLNLAPHLQPVLCRLRVVDTATERDGVAAEPLRDAVLFV
mmetsp:Transcript_13959/g.45871  ORF Transcript_13959/g.45871 Transcript_13959/m.45871 type:complete len:302 (-) Transcript_13959:218-1123(-)